MRVRRVEKEESVPHSTHPVYIKKYNAVSGG